MGVRPLNAFCGVPLTRPAQAVLGMTLTPGPNGTSNNVIHTK